MTEPAQHPPKETVYSKISTHNEKKSHSTMVKSRLSEVKKEFKNWSLHIQMDCYPKIFRTDYLVAQVTWSAILLVFTGFTASLVIFNIVNYYAYEVVTKIEAFHQVPTEFPTVTICDSNSFSTKTAEDLIRNISIREFGHDLMDLPFMEAYAILPKLTELTKMYVARPEFSRDEKKKLGFNLGQIWECQFNGKICNISRDFRWHYSYNYGNCFQFNSGLDDSNRKVSLKKTTLEDQNFGFSLTLVMSNQNKYPMTDSKGIRVYIHNNTLTPINTQGIFLKPGEKTVISMQRTFFHNHPHPYSECQDLGHFKSELYSYLMVIKHTLKLIIFHQQK